MADLDVACEVEVSSSSSVSVAYQGLPSVNFSGTPAAPSSSSTFAPTSSTLTSLLARTVSDDSTTPTKVTTAPTSSISMDVDSSSNISGGNDVICIGEYRPSTAILPCFLPCCRNVFANRMIPVRLVHSTQSRDVIRPTFSGIMMSHPRKRLRRPASIFPEPPESEWTTTTVYHWDPMNEVIRYKCTNCPRLVEKWSFQRRTQFYMEHLPKHCINCNQLFGSGINEDNEFLNHNYTKMQSLKIIHCLPRPKLHTIKRPYPNKRPPPRN